MRDCPRCGGPVETRFRFCPWCSAPQRRKIVEFFPAHAALLIDRGKALRVSRYVHEGHVRFSVWNESGVADGVVSIADEEADRLARFLVDSAAELREQAANPS